MYVRTPSTAVGSLCHKLDMNMYLQLGFGRARIDMLAGIYPSI